MWIFLKIFLLGLSFVGFVQARPRPETTNPAGILTTGYSAPPPGFDTSKHKTPPDGFIIPNDIVISATPWNNTDLLKRQVIKDLTVHVVLCDNWFFGGQCVDYSIQPNAQTALLSWWGNMNDRTSSFRVYVPSLTWARCRLFLDYYYDSNGPVCSGAYFDSWVSPGFDSYNDALQNPYNDAISCLYCGYF
ncbi:hypothetical protein H072_8246 [Dactylellina haptotyla CBS 200.50]|uniref:Uncharacterized protein n=1 Tax=Dactylellina haptotyla (strain CBS 200.50) TaxID=1284197 RepID=S8A5G0_DACHA|nr:hypothetical protein H072_8246 [Dactylellina haptotyla CBS 200.50]